MFNVSTNTYYVNFWQIAQVPKRNEPDTFGEINYKYILQHIENCGYEDWIGLEYKPAGNSKDGLKWIKEFGYSL